MRKESFPICSLADSDLKSAPAVAVDMERDDVVAVVILVVVVGRVKAVQLAAAAIR